MSLGLIRVKPMSLSKDEMIQKSIRLNLGIWKKASIRI
jgi:hypothetical protein